MAINAGTLDLPINDMMKRVTLNVNVTGLQRFRIRMWLARRVLGLGAALLGCNVRINEEPEIIK
jgi:hypothetical protein